MRKLLLLAWFMSASAAVLGADARALFEAGSKALTAGNADEAVKDFEAAYAAQPAPSLLFWLGEGYRARGDNARATAFYEDYLRKLPAGPKAADAKARLSELQAAKRAQKPKRARRRVAKSAAQDKALPLMPLTLDAAPPPPASAPPPPASPAPLQLPPSRQPASPPATLPVVISSSQTPAAAAVPPPLAQPVARPAEVPRTQLVSPPAAPPPTLTFAQYTGRILVVKGSKMQRYSTLPSPTSLYTHGAAIGAQTGHFRNAAYLGFGTEIGTRDGSDTLHRYELSWQCLWTPLGPYAVVTPYLGFRLGGMIFQSLFLTAGNARTAFVVAPQAGVLFQLGHYFALDAGMGYDANLGPDLGPNASISGYSFDFGASIRF